MGILNQAAYNCMASLGSLLTIDRKAFSSLRGRIRLLIEMHLKQRHYPLSYTGFPLAPKR